MASAHIEKAVVNFLNGRKPFETVVGKAIFKDTEEGLARRLTRPWDLDPKARKGTFFNIRQQAQWLEAGRLLLKAVAECRPGTGRNGLPRTEVLERAFEGMMKAYGKAGVLETVYPRDMIRDSESAPRVPDPKKGRPDLFRIAADNVLNVINNAMESPTRPRLTHELETAFFRSDPPKNYQPEKHSPFARYDRVRRTLPRLLRIAKILNQNSVNQPFAAALNHLDTEFWCGLAKYDLDAARKALSSENKDHGVAARSLTALREHIRSGALNQETIMEAIERHLDRKLESLPKKQGDELRREVQGLLFEAPRGTV